MSKPTGYVVDDDGTMRAVYDTEQDVQVNVASSGGGLFEPDLAEIATAVGVDLEELGDIDAKLAEAGAEIDVIAAAAGITALQVRAVVVALAGFTGDEDNPDEPEVPVGQNGPDLDANAGEGGQGDGQGEDPAPDYSSLSKAKLEEEVALRNSERDPDDVDYIVVDAPGNKAELVAALQADDQVED